MPISKTLLLNLVLSVAGAILVTAAQAREFTAGDLTIDHPWSPPTPGAAPTGVGYMVLKNQGEEADRLLSASAEVAKSTTLHATVMENSVMKMVSQEAIEIPAGGEVSLEPGGPHVMFVNISQPFKEGDRFPLTLRFERAGEVTVEVAVEPRPGDAPMDHGKHKR